MDEERHEFYNVGPVQGQVPINYGTVNINVGSSEVQLRQPRSYLPLFRDKLFHERPGEFERLEALLFDADGTPNSIQLALVAVTGMGGVGKTQLAVELAYRYWDRFCGGVFWTTATGKSLFDWQHQFAQLALDTAYLPKDDDTTKPDNERRRALYFCSYLADSKDTLLILDNVEYPQLINSILPNLFGKEPNCTILYTSRNQFVSYGVKAYAVEQLSESVALHLLLATTRPMLLKSLELGNEDEEVKAARDVCHIVGYLPLALVHLRRILERDQQMSLARLASILKQKGTLDIIKTLFETFRFSWNYIEDEQARDLFKLACYFPEATPIPLWLLGLAAGLGEQKDILEPLGEIYRQLRDASLLEELMDDLVRLHPIIREFGQRLIIEEHKNEVTLRKLAEKRLIDEFMDLNNLENRAKREGYRQCLEQIRLACDFLELLKETNQVVPLRRIERWLSQEGYLFISGNWWPQKISGLFYQQFFNKAVEECYPINFGKTPDRWLRQENSVGAEDSALIGIFIGHTEGLRCVAFSPDGRRILTGSRDGTARLWDVQSGQELARFTHIYSVDSIAFSPNGKNILTGSFDCTVRLWNTEDGQELRSFLGHRGGVNSVAFSPDGKQALTGSEDRTARLWNTEDGQELARLRDHEAPVRKVIFSLDGKWILTVSDTIFIWVVTNSNRPIRMKTCEYYGFDAVFSPDTNSIVTISSENIISIWEKSNSRIIAELNGHTSGITSVTISSDGRQILTGSDDATARLWDVIQAREPQIVKGHLAVINNIAFSPDGTKLVSGSDDGTARLWSVIDGNQSILYNEVYGVNTVAFSPDGRSIVTGVKDGTVGIWASDFDVELMRLEGHKDQVISVVFSCDGKQILTGSADHTAIVWDVQHKQELMHLKGHTEVVSAVAFSPDGKRMLTGSFDHSAIVWDTKSGQKLNRLQGHHGITSIVFSPDGKQVLIGSYDQTARLWNVENGKELLELYHHNGVVSNMAFSLDRKCIISCDNHGWVYFWSIDGTKMGTLLGIYIAPYEIGALYRQDARHIWLADKGSSGGFPHIYRLQLEGPW